MKNIRFFLSENFQFLVVKFSVYLNRLVFVMRNNRPTSAVSDLILYKYDYFCDSMFAFM